MERFKIEEGSWCGEPSSVGCHLSTFSCPSPPFLFRLVNMHAVITDTQRDIAQVQSKVNKLLDEDVDNRALVSLQLLTNLTLTILISSGIEA